MGYWSAVERAVKKDGSTDERYTRRADFEDVERRYGVRFTLDACALDSTAAKCARYVRPPNGRGGVGVDGLTFPWAREIVWDNCPYSNIEPWCLRHWREASSPFSMLYVPNDRADRPWWQKYIEPFLPQSTAYAPEEAARLHGFNLHGVTLRVTNRPGRANFDLHGGSTAGDNGMFGIVEIAWDRRFGVSAAGGSGTRRRD